MSTHTSKVYVVVLNWNHAADTIVCVDSLRKLDHANCAVVICDNASQPEDVATLREWGAGLAGGLVEYWARSSPQLPVAAPLPAGLCMLMHTGANLGFAGGMNVGVRFALAQGDCDYVWILNNDTEVATDALRRLVERMAQDARIGICGSTLIEFDARHRVQALGGAAYLPWRARSIALGRSMATDQIPADPSYIEQRMAYVIGASMLVSRGCLLRIGLMDERYFLYSEEHDWAERSRRLGYRLGYAPKSFVFHRHGATIGTDPSGGSDLSLFYLYRSKVMFTLRFYPAWIPTAVSCLFWEGLKFALKGHPGKAKAVFHGIAAAVLQHKRGHGAMVSMTPATPGSSH